MSRLAMALLLVACAGTAATNESQVASTSTLAATTTSGSAVVASTSTLAATTTSGSVVSGTFSVNGHDLYIECSGAGSPTFLLEAGEDQSGSSLADYRDALAERGTVCSYDRANTGRSGSVPGPRTAADAASDLNGLLTAASISGPYLLLGHSAGGMIVQLYARQYPDDVIAVVAMNPVPPYQEWFDQGVPLMDGSSQTAEAAYYAGANGESLDYQTSSRQVADAQPPPDIPFAMLLSTIAQCESPEGVCAITYTAYEDIMRAVVEEWPGGEFTQFDAGHLLPTDEVIDVIDRILGA